MVPPSARKTRQALSTGLGRLPVLRSLHWVIAQAMARSGYAWEERRSGELKLGLWRKRWKTGGQRSGGRKLVLLPGFGDTPSSWLIVLMLIRGRIRAEFDEIALIDFPGFSGFLSRERAFHSIELLKTSLFDLLDSLRPAALLGHSLGGWLAALYAVDCGRKLRPKAQAAGSPAYAGPAQLILADPSGFFADEGEGRELQAKFKAAIAARERGFEAIREHVFAKQPFWLDWVGPQLSSFFESDEIAQFVDSVEPAHVLSKETLALIQARVCLIWGENDTLIPPTHLSDWLRALNSGGPRAQAILLRGSGHSPQVEAPAALAFVLSQMLGSRSEESRYLRSPLARRWWTVVDPLFEELRENH